MHESSRKVSILAFQLGGLDTKNLGARVAWSPAQVTYIHTRTRMTYPSWPYIQNRSRRDVYLKLKLGFDCVGDIWGDVVCNLTPRIARTCPFKFATYGGWPALVATLGDLSTDQGIQDTQDRLRLCFPMRSIRGLRRFAPGSGAQKPIAKAVGMEVG